VTGLANGLTVLVEEDPVNVDNDVLYVELGDPTSQRKLDMLWVDKTRKRARRNKELGLVAVLRSRRGRRSTG
jgi:hypothetical protein